MCADGAWRDQSATIANDFRTQFASRQGVDRCVDGFVRNLQCGCPGMHKRQCASDLFGRVARFQIMHNMTPQGGSRLQTAFNARGERADLSTPLGKFSMITACHRRERWPHKIGQQAK